MTQTRRSTASRAENVRNRRDQQSTKRVQQAGLHAHRPTETPRVMVRGVGVTLDKQRFNPPRRRVSINMGSSGAELQMPAIPMVQPGWRLLSGLIAVVTGLLFFILTTASEFEVNAIQFNGIQRIGQEVISQSLGLEGSSIFEFIPADAVKILQQDFPELVDVQVKAVLPGTITITAAERQPMIAWNTGETILWIDGAGSAYPARGEAGPMLTVTSTGEPPYLHPVTDSKDVDSENEDTAGEAPETVSGPAWPKQIPGDLLEAVYDLSAMLPPESVLNYDSVSGLGWDDSAGWKVYIGPSLLDLDIKLAMYQTIVENLSAQGIQPTLISVESVHAPYYRLEI